MVAGGLEQIEQVVTTVAKVPEAQLWGLWASSLGQPIGCRLMWPHCYPSSFLVHVITHSGLSPMISISSALHWAKQPGFRKLLLVIYLKFFSQDPIGPLALNSSYPQLYQRVIVIQHCVNFHFPSFVCREDDQMP